MPFSKVSVFLDKNSQFDEKQIKQINSMLKSVYNNLNSKGQQTQLEDKLRENVLLGQTGRCYEVQVFADYFNIYIYTFISLRGLQPDIEYPLFELDIPDGLSITHVYTKGYLDKDMTKAIDLYGYCTADENGNINFKCTTRPENETDNCKITIHIRLEGEK